MDFGYYSRLQNSLPGAAASQANPLVCLHRNGEDSNLDRDRKAAGEGGDKPSRNHRWLHKQCVSGSKERGPMEVDTQPEGPECIHNTRAFQDGRYTFREGSPGQRRLHVQARFERCIPVSTDQSSTSEVPPISMAGSDISIQCSTLWAGNCTSCIHEASQACPSPPQSQGPEISGLFGRYPIDRERQGRCRASISSGETVVGGPRFCDQSGEVTIRSNTMHRISGIHGKLRLNDVHTANSKSEGNKEQVQASSKAGEADDTPLGTYHRCVNINPPCDSPSTSTLSRSSSTKDQRASPPPLIRIDGNVGEAECDGFELVDQQCGDHQWETNSPGTTRDDNRIRCFEYRMGSLLEQPENRRSLVVPGISATYQCKGVASGISSPPNLCREQGRNSCSPENRQYDGSLLHQSDGWYPFQETDGDHISNLELESAQENIPVSRTSSRSPECRCGSRITQEAGQLRMEAGSFNISTNHANSGPLPSGSFCLQNISSTSQIYELEAGSGGNCNRCPEPTLDEHERLCLSPVCVDRQMPIQDTEGGSQGDNTHCTSMANSAMVLSPPINVVSETTPPSETATPSDKPQQQQSSTDTSVESSRVANIRDSLDHQGISSQATTLILSSWRKSTEEAYSCCWRKWEQWCASFGHSSIQAPIGAILDFLACQFAEGKQYRTINSYRSAISMTHNPIDGVVVGKHPLVTRLMKGIFNRRPPQPRYASTWDVGGVLEHIRSLGGNSDLSLKQLSYKLVVLLALSNASRASEIHALDIRYLSRNENGATFTITKLTKTAQPGKKKVVHYLPLKQENRLCPIAALEEYLKRTSPIRRNDTSKTQLLLSVMKPFHPVSKCTIARWMKVLIQQAGVGQEFSAHSIRGAASTAAMMKGMSISEVLRIADWSSDNVFKAFYFKPTDTRPQSFLNTIVN